MAKIKHKVMIKEQFTLDSVKIKKKRQQAYNGEPKIHYSNDIPICYVCGKEIGIERSVS